MKIRLCIDLDLLNFMTYVKIKILIRSKIINKFLEPVTGAVLGKIIVLILIIILIQKRPQGLFALKGRMVDN